MDGEGTIAASPVSGVEHWTRKGEIRLFLWEKYVGAPEPENAPVR